MKVSFIRPLGSIPQTPAVVQHVVATVISATEVDLVWDAIAGSENYTVRINGNPVVTLPATAAQFTMLAPSTQYSFTVSAINSFGEGPQCPPVLATTLAALLPPDKVVGLIANPVSTTEIDLKWSPAARGSNYLIQRNGVTVASTAVLTFNDTGLTQATGYTYTLIATNTAGSGPTSDPVVAFTQAAAGGPGLRKNFGIYPSFYYSSGITLNSYNNNDHAIITSTASVPQVTGFHGQLLWRAIDKGAAGAAGPAYDWSITDAYVAGCAAASKQAWFTLAEAFIGNGANVASGAKVVPDWISTKMGGPQFNTINYDTSTGITGGVVTKRYDATTVGYFIKFLTDFVARYDSNPNVEGITFWEETAYAVDHTGTTVTAATPGADFSASKQVPQLIRILNAIRDPAQINAQHMNVFMGANYLFQGQFDTQASWDSVFTAMKGAKSGFMGPDTWLQTWTVPNLPVTNANYPQQNANAVTNTPHSGRNGYFRSLPSDNYYRGWFGGTDWRNQVLCFPRCEVTDLGGYVTKSLSPVPTPQELYTTRMLYDKAQYFSFDCITPFSGYNPGTGAFPGAGPAQQWSTGGLPFIKSLTLPTTNNVSPYP